MKRVDRTDWVCRKDISIAGMSYPSFAACKRFGIVAADFGIKRTMSMVLGLRMIYLIVEDESVYKFGIFGTVRMAADRTVIIYIDVLNNGRTADLYMILLSFLFYGDFPLSH